MQGSVALGLVMKLKTCSPSSALPGTSKLARLKRLNTSVRNWKLRCSSMRKFLTIERSTLLKFGPVRMFLPDEPRNPGTGGANAAGLNQTFGVGPPGGVKLTPGSRLGRPALSSVPSWSASPRSRTLKGTPEASDTIVLNCQPAANKPLTPFIFLPKGKS